MLSLALLSFAPAAALAASAYAPSFTTCPDDSSLVRSADGISSSEASYIASRKANADSALQAWLADALPSVDTGSLPTIALSNSGGGFRALLIGAGVIQALDSRDSNSSTAGLYQALTYHAALSGGAWLLSALAAGNWPTISDLETVWETQLAGGILDSTNSATVTDYEQIAVDILAKGSAGFPVSLTDPWGRELSYQVMLGGQGTPGFTMSNITSLSNFTSYNVPFPIMTTTKINFSNGECEPTQNEAIFEFNPYEFGSWSSDVSAFVRTEYLGSNLTAGVASECVTGFDRIDWAMGTSSNLLEYYICNAALGVDITEYFPSSIVSIVEDYTPASQYGYSIVTNPFKGFNSTTATADSSVFALDTLYFVDGAEPNHNDPILPLLEPTRNVSVLIINDNGNDEDDYPDGAAVVAAWEATQTGRLAGRFPQVPAVGNFSTHRAQFFGCSDLEAVTVIYLPNSDWTFASNTSTLELEYTASETAAMISNGGEVATQGGDDSWASCLACGLMLKEVGSANLPSGCDECLSEYCWSA